MMAIWGLLILLLGIMGVGLGYQTGAPQLACTTMLPGHDNTVAMDTESPYRLEVDASTVVPEGEITVSITGTEQFRGFLIQARRANDGSTEPVGLFTSRDSGAQSVSCGNRSNSALTHTQRRRGRRSFTAGWRAPRGDVEQVYFTATVVQMFDTYWVGITSPIVTVGRRPITTALGYSTVAQSTSGDTISLPETTAIVSTMESTPSTMSRTQRETESISTQNETNQTNFETSNSSESTTVSEETVPIAHVSSTLFDSLDNTSAQPTTESTTPLETTLSTTLRQTSLTTPVDELIVSTPSPTIKQISPDNNNQSLVSTATLITTNLVEVTAQTHFDEASTLSEVTTHSGTVTDDDTPSISLVSTTPLSDENTPSEYETTVGVPGDEPRTSSPYSTVVQSTTDSATVNLTSATQQFNFSQPQPHTDTSTLSSETSTVPQDATRPASPLSTITEDATSRLSYNDSTTQKPEISTTASVDLSPLIELSTTPSINSTRPSVYDYTTPYVGNTSALMEPSTTFSNDTSTNPQNDTSAAPSTDRPISTTLSVDVSTSVYNTSTTYPFNTSTTLSTTATAPSVNASTTLSTNTSASPSNATTPPVHTSHSPTSISRKTSTAETSTTPTVQTWTEYTTDMSTKVTTELKTSSLSTTSSSLSPNTVLGTEETRSPTELTTVSSSITTDGSTSESTSESTSMSTSPAVVTTSDPHVVNPGITTARTVIERQNEIRMRLRIENFIFTDDLKNPNSEAFRNVARQVEKEVWDLYIRGDITTVFSVTVLQITRGSVVPEVQILASETLDDSTKTAWLSLMYNEVHNNGGLGNLSVSDLSAVASDGTFTPVDPCFLLPCPASMVCFLYQTRCLSNCYLNTNYCLNNGVCKEPSGNKQLVSCSCDTSHEGERCDVRKDPINPPSAENNSHFVVAMVWGSIGAACLVFILICVALLYRNRKRKRQRRHMDKLIGSAESGMDSSRRAQMDSYARRLTSIRAGVLIDLANISISESEGESSDAGKFAGAASFSDAESVDQPRFIDGGVHIGGMPDILMGASTTDYEMDFMNRPLSPNRKSVSFNYVTEMIDFVATENFTLGSKDGAEGNFQVRWDFQVDRSDSRETDS